MGLSINVAIIVKPIIEKEDIEKCLRAIDPFIMFPPIEEVRNRMIEKIFLDEDWGIFINKDGNLVIDEFCGEKYHRNEEFLKKISPFCRDFEILVQIENEHYAWINKDHAFHEYVGRVVYDQEVK